VIAVKSNAAKCAVAHVGGLQKFDQDGDLFEEISEICSHRGKNIGSTKFEHGISAILETVVVWPTSSMIHDHFDP
jgi:hypothetical protein